MRRRIFISVGSVLLLVVSYEVAFRYVTRSCGEIDMKTQPLRVYYSDDLFSSFAWRSALFGFRTHMPFGKVKLAKGTGAYVDGGRFYRRAPDGSWSDMTDTLIEYQRTKE